MISTDSKYLDQYMSKKSSERLSKPESSDNEYMPLKPTQYMLENPMEKHGHGYMHPDSSEETPDIRKFF